MLFRRYIPVVGLLVHLLFCSDAQGAISVAEQKPRTANVMAGARLFPESTVLYVEIPDLGQLADELHTHPVYEKIVELDDVQRALGSPQMAQALIGLAYVESQIGEKWLPALKKLTGNGLFIGVDPLTEGVGVAFRATDEQLLKKTAGVLLAVMQGDGGQPVDVDEYRGGKFAELDEVVVARFGDWFLISNKQVLAKQMADNLLDEKRGLMANAGFRNSRDQVDSGADVWVYINLQSLRELNVAEALLRGATDEPATELLIGGILEAFKTASSATVSLTLGNQSLSLDAILPFDAEQFDPARQFFFGVDGQGRAPQPLAIPDLIGQLATYRDIGGWWLSKETLFPENVIAQLAQGDSQLSTVFGGLDFGQDVLTEFEPEIRMVVKRQTFSDELKPDVVYPAVAMVGRLKHPEMERRFRIAFQSVVGFLNINASQVGSPPIELITTNEDGIRVTSGEYLVDSESDSGLVIFNFSPAIAFQGDYIVISSTAQLAREVAIATRQLGTAIGASDSNTMLTVDAAMLKQSLVAVRPSMVAQSMVQGGKTRNQAEAEIDLILEVIDTFKQGTIDFRVETGRLGLKFQVDFADVATK